jgi:hypothetical protein
VADRGDHNYHAYKDVQIQESPGKLVRAGVFNLYDGGTVHASPTPDRRTG